MGINFFILFLVSLPEAFLNLILILLFSERKNCLKIRRKNIIQFSITLSLMLIASWFLRPLAPNPAFNMMLHIIAYVVIIMIVYRMNLGSVFLSVTTVMMYMSSIENSYIPFVIAYKIKDMTAFFGSNPTILICSLPVRILQCLAVYLLWKYNEVFIITRINKRIRMIFIVCNLIIIFTQMYFSNIYAVYFSSLSFVHQILYALALVILILAFDFLIFSFMYITVKGVMMHGYNRYLELEDNAKYAFNEVYNLLKDKNDVKGAISLLVGLIGKDENKDEINQIGGEKNAGKIDAFENGENLQIDS